MILQPYAFCYVYCLPFEVGKSVIDEVGYSGQLLCS